MRTTRVLLVVGCLLALLIGAVFGPPLHADPRTIHPGKARWPIKTSVQPGTPKVVPLADLLTLADPPGVTKHDPRFQATRIPQFPNALGVQEGDLVTVIGWLHLVAGEDDGDYHIQVSYRPTSGDQCLIVEVPRPEPAFVASGTVRQTARTVRDFIKSKLLHNQEPSSRGSVMTHPVLVTITGQLFYDDAHVGDEPRGKKGMKAATLWELHPVTAIGFAPTPP